MTKYIGFILVSSSTKEIICDSYGNVVVCPSREDALLAIKTENLNGFEPKPLVKWRMNTAARRAKRTNNKQGAV